MLDWIQSNDTLLWWLAAASVATFLGTLIAIPLIVSWIPADYFTRDPKNRGSKLRQTHPALRITLIVAKNAVGVMFLLAGIAMLALPGQGLITMLIGMMLLNFPGKFALERAIVRQRPVLRAINWMRRKRHRPPLEPPPKRDAGKSELAQRREAAKLG